MTIPNTNRRTDSLGNGTTATYPYSFRITDKTDISIYHVPLATGSQSKLTVDVDYTVNGPFNTDGGGTYTIINAALLDGGGFLATGDTLTVLGNRAIDQTTSYKNQSSYLPARHENSLDDLTVTAQQNKEVLDRSLKFEESSSSTDSKIPAPVTDSFLKKIASGWQWVSSILSTVTPNITTLNSIVRWGNVTGSEVKNTGIVIDDSDNMSGIGNIALSGTVDGRDVSADGAVLDDAVLNADVSTAPMGFVIDEDNMVSDLDTKVPTQQSTKAYVDNTVAAAVTNGMTYKGDYDAATNTPDLDTAPSGVSIGDTYTVTVAGTFFTATVEIGDSLIAKQDTATLESHWTIVQANLTPASIKTQYESNSNTNAYTDAEKTKLNGLTGGFTTTGITNTFNAAVGDYYIVSGANTFTGTLPASHSAGDQIALYCEESYTGIMTVDGNGAQTIGDGDLTYKMAAGDYLLLESDGTNWRIKDKKGKVYVFAQDNGAQVLVAGTSRLQFFDNHTDKHLAFSGNDTFVAPRGGFYTLTCVMSLVGSIAFNLRVFINGTESAAGGERPANANANVSVTHTVKLSAGDSLWVVSNAGGTRGTALVDNTITIMEE